MKHENQDVISESCIRNDEGKLVTTEEDRLKGWKDNYNHFLNIEFPWESESLTEQEPVQDPARLITEGMVRGAINYMKNSRAAGPAEIVVEMIRADGPLAVTEITKLVNLNLKEGYIPEEWNLSYVINCYKGKGDALERGSCRGLKILDQVLKIVEHVLENFIKDEMCIDSMQFGLMKGKGTTDAIFIMQQLQEKYIGKKKDLYSMFVDLEYAFERIPRKVLW